MNRTLPALVTTMLVAALATPLAARGGINGDVLRIDHQKQCLWLDWDNDTERIACWTTTTTFSVLDTGKARTAADVRRGSHVRMQGEDRDQTYWATEIVIGEAASQPPGRMERLAF